MVKIGIIGAGLRSGIAKYWHNPSGKVLEVSQALSIDSFQFEKEEIQCE